jgi:hypothetical protein
MLEKVPWPRGLHNRPVYVIRSSPVSEPNRNGGLSRMKGGGDGGVLGEEGGCGNILEALGTPRRVLALLSLAHGQSEDQPYVYFSLDVTGLH